MKLSDTNALRQFQPQYIANAKLSFLALAIAAGLYVGPVQSETNTSDQNLILSYVTLGDEEELRSELPAGVCALPLSILDEGETSDLGALLDLPTFDLDIPDETINDPIRSCQRVPNA